VTQSQSIKLHKHSH